ncbi:MAG TPA: hypothetical protein VHV57_04315 [Acidimicrobiales bacterium]|nr:hypothetical protein [Acidimicrobiales bacterium]
MKRSSLWRRAGLGLAVLTAALTGATAAGAAGNAGLDRHIIANPVSSWMPRSASYVNTFVTYVSGVEQAAVRPLGGDAVTAAEAWQDPSSSDRTLLIGLIGFSDPSLTPARLVRQTRGAARSGAASFCAGATDRPAASDVAVSGIPGAREVTCHAGQGGAQSTAITWGKSNVLAMVVSQRGAMSQARLEGIARLEYAAMGMTTAPVTGSNSDVLFLIVGGSIVGAIFGVGLSLQWVRRRHSTHPTDDIAVGRFVDSYAPSHHDEVEAMLAGISAAQARVTAPDDTDGDRDAEGPGAEADSA